MKLLSLRSFCAATKVCNGTNDLLGIPAVNLRLAGELSGFDVAYGHEAKEALASGKQSAGVRVPDIDIVVDGTESALHSLLTDGNWLHVQFDTKSQAAAPTWLSKEKIRFVSANVSEHLSFNGLRAVLVRPDGFVASVVG